MPFTADPRVDAYTQEGFLPEALERSGRLRAGLSKEEALAVIWPMTGPDVF